MLEHSRNLGDRAEGFKLGAAAWLIFLGTALLFAPAHSGDVEIQPLIETEAGQAGIWSTDESLSAVPGQFVIKYKNSVREPVEALLASGRDLASAIDGGDDSLDRLHRRHDLLAARPVFRPAEDPSSAARSIAEIRLERESRLRSNGFAVPVDLPDLSHVYVVTLGPCGDVAAAVEEFGRNPHVEYAHPNYRATVQWIPDDPFFHSTGSWGQTEEDLWGLKKLDTEHAWDIADGEGIVVAVNDTGLDRTHPEIAENVWSNDDEIPANGVDDDGNGYIDDTYGWNFVSDDNAPVDGHGHGTHVSGTIAAVGNNGLGIIGVAPRARILPVKGFGDGGTGSADHIAAGLVYAAENGADVINNSWGCSAPCPSVPLYEDAVRFAHDLGVTVVFAAGNKSADIINYCPQNLPESIVVTASTQDDTAAHFTSFGFVDVAAPGGGIVIPAPPTEAYRNILSLKSAVCSPAMCPDYLVVADDYLRQAGTSMSAPHAAGVAALILQVHPEYGPEQVRQALRRGSDAVGEPGFDFYTGYGRLDAAAAVAEPDALAVLVTGATPAFPSGTYAVDVHGLAYGPGFESWSLEYGAGSLPSAWTEIAASTIPVPAAGLLAQWNVDNVPDGTYSLRLRASSAEGGQYEDRHPTVLDRVVIDEPAASPLAIFRGGENISIVGTVAPPEFVSYGIRIQNSGGLWLADPAVTLAGDGLEEVVDGYLGAWDTTHLSADHYRIHLEVQLATGDTIVESVQVIVDPALHEGWPITLGRLSFGIMMLTITDHLDMADVNGDGKEEVIVGYGTTVRIFDSSGQALPGWPQSVDPNERGGLIQKSPVVADLDGDGMAEIVAYNNTGEILVWNADGTPYGNWPMFVGGSLNSLAIADMDGDGLNDIIAAGWDRSVRVFDHQGAMLPGWPTWLNTGTTSRILMQPSVADLDLDGAPELVVLAMMNLYVLRSDGSIAPGWPRIVNPPDIGYPHSYPALADLDGDHDLEVVIGSLDGFVHAFHHDGTDVSGWPQSVPPDVNSPTIGDIDGDGLPEVVAGVDTVLVDYRKTSQLYAWNGDGTPVPGWPVIFTLTSNHTASAFGFGAAALIDLDADGVSEIIASSDVNADKPFALKAYHGDASPVFGFRRPTGDLGASSVNTAAAGDVDGDGLLELAWIDKDSRLYLWDLDAFSAASQAWPMYHHDAKHSGARYELFGCVPPDGPDYISLFSNADCTGTESYYTGYFNSGYRCRPDLAEEAVCGTLLHTAAARSYMRQGVCVENAWPSGNLLSGLVRVHRDGCVPEASSCGDDLCDEFENCAICPYDCGACTVCGNGICESPEETPSTCPKDCRGKPEKP